MHAAALWASHSISLQETTEAWVGGLLLSTSLPDGHWHTKYILCNSGTPQVVSLWFPNAVSPAAHLSEGCSGIYLSRKVPLFSRLPALKPKEITAKPPPVQLTCNFENNIASVMLKREGYFLTQWWDLRLFFLRHFPGPSFQSGITNLSWKVKLSPQPRQVRQLGEGKKKNLESFTDKSVSYI